MINIIIEGVGGQGTLLASRILGNLAMDSGFDVKVSEVHGMAQRGGSVITHVRIGDKPGERVYSPLVERGGADYLLAFERLEALRALPYVKDGGAVITNTQIIPPMPVITGAAKYPDDIIERLDSSHVGTVALDAQAIAVESGSVRSVNLVLLGVLSNYCHFTEGQWLTAIKTSVPPKSYETNEKAFKAGRGFISGDTEKLKDMLKSYYDQEAPRRNEHEMQEWKAPLRENFLNTIKSEGKSSLLELGAGSGKDSRFFMENGLEVTALDLSKEMVEVCKGKGINALELDFHDLKPLARTFDAVWAMNTLLHVRRADLPAVLSGISDILNPSGLFCMTVYGGEDWEGILNGGEFGPRYFTVYTDESLKSVLSETFEIISFTTTQIEGANWKSQSVTMRKR